MKGVVRFSGRLCCGGCQEWGHVRILHGYVTTNLTLLEWSGTRQSNGFSFEARRRKCDSGGRKWKRERSTERGRAGTEFRSVVVLATIVSVGIPSLLAGRSRTSQLLYLSPRPTTRCGQWLRRKANERSQPSFPVRNSLCERRKPLEPGSNEGNMKKKSILHLFLKKQKSPKKEIDRENKRRFTGYLSESVGILIGNPIAWTGPPVWSDRLAVTFLGPPNRVASQSEDPWKGTVRSTFFFRFVSFDFLSTRGGRFRTIGDCRDGQARKRPALEFFFSFPPYFLCSPALRR